MIPGMIPHYENRGFCANIEVSISNVFYLCLICTLEYKIVNKLINILFLFRLINQKELLLTLVHLHQYTEEYVHLPRKLLQ